MTIPFFEENSYTNISGEVAGNQKTESPPASEAAGDHVDVRGLQM